MDSVGPWLYLAVFAGAAVLSVMFTPLALRFARRNELLDLPGGHKGHDAAVPYLGGMAIAAAFAVAVLLAAVVQRPPSGLGELAIVLAAALVLAFIGLLDDLRGLGVAVRIAAQVAAGVAVWWVGAGVQLFTMDALNLAVTVVWVVGITNAFNLLDNMDGLSAGVAAIAAITFAVIAVLNGQFLVAALGAALAGCAVGFLRQNFHPATIYMGDAGSLFLGFLLAYLGVKLRFDGPTSVTFFVPITVLAIAILDTTLVTVTRLLHGRSPLVGGRDHVSHRLVFVGIPVPYAVTLVYAAAFGHGWLAIVMSRVDVTTGFILMGFIICADVFLGVVLAQTPVYETSRRRRMMIQEVREHDPEVRV
jgi:UDP-GlcNAc:undecaprenyl-phosphate GlcNAc-1-phosphate transferase